MNTTNTDRRWPHRPPAVIFGSSVGRHQWQFPNRQSRYHPASVAARDAVVRAGAPFPPIDPDGTFGNTAQLDAEIVARVAALAQRKSDRAARLRAGADIRPSSVEPHRDWHVYALGADLVQCGLRARDAFGLMGLRSLPLADAIQMLLDADHESPGVYLGRLLPIIIDRHRATLEPRGQYVSWRRRWVRYQADLASWAAQPDTVKGGHWRERPMTSGQRELIRETATWLDLPMPGDLKRGAAAAWLDRHGANLTFRREI